MRRTDVNYASALRAAGVPIGLELGHGAYGTVFDHAARPGWVIKVTTSSPEYRAARYVATHSYFSEPPHVCLPRVGDFFDVSLRLEGFRGDGRVWVFEREALGDWTVEANGITWGNAYTLQREIADGYRGAVSALLDAVMMATIKRMNGDVNRWTVRGLIRRDREIKERVWHTYRTYNADLALWAYDTTLSVLGSVRRDMISFAEWCRDHEITLRDMNRENWGVRADGRVLVRDLGGFGIP